MINIESSCAGMYTFIMYATKTVWTTSLVFFKPHFNCILCLALNNFTLTGCSFIEYWFFWFKIYWILSKLRVFNIKIWRWFNTWMWQNWPVIRWCRSVSLFVSMLSVFNPHKLCCRADIDHIDRTDDRTAADVDLQNIHCLPAIRLPAICLCFLFLLPLVFLLHSRSLTGSVCLSLDLSDISAYFNALCLGTWWMCTHRIHAQILSGVKTVAKPSKWS